MGFDVALRHASHRAPAHPLMHRDGVVQSHTVCQPAFSVCCALMYSVWLGSHCKMKRFSLRLPACCERHLCPPDVTPLGTACVLHVPCKTDLAPNTSGDSSNRQKAVVSLLESYSSRSDRTTRVECPRWLWLWYLLCPAVLYGATLALCQVSRCTQLLNLVYLLLHGGTVLT